MKKFILLAIVFIAAGILAWKLLSDKPHVAGPPPDKPLSISKNSGPFTDSVAALLNNYFAVRDALVDWDTLKADQAAYQLASRADSLPVGLIKGDSGIVLTAKSLTAMVGGDARGLVGESGIEARRHSFSVISEQMYDLLRAIKYEPQVYQIRCPMAFSDSVAATWLSDNSAVINPYLGDKHPVYKAKMLHCGEVVDSLHGR